MQIFNHPKKNHDKKPGCYPFFDKKKKSKNSYFDNEIIIGETNIDGTYQIRK